MGTRSATETVAGIFVAFFSQNVWAQAELARHLGVETRALRRRLEELCRTGAMPLERQEDPPHVYWSVKKGWVPGGVVLSGADAGRVLGLLARLPKSAERDRLLKKFTGQLGQERLANAASLRGDEQILQIISDAASRRQAVRLDYHSTSRGEHRWRVASVHHLSGGERWRFVATCHERGALSWFRVDNVLAASVAADDSFLAVEATVLERFLAASIDGFSGGGSPVHCAFEVRYPEARWVRANLPADDAITVDEIDGALRFTCETTAVVQLARFVVGLGAAVIRCSAELAAAVIVLANESLSAVRPQNAEES